MVRVWLGHVIDHEHAAVARKKRANVRISPFLLSTSAGRGCLDRVNAGFTIGCVCRDLSKKKQAGQFPATAVGSFRYILPSDDLCL